MKKIKINEDGFIESPYIHNANIVKEIDDETYEKLMSCRIGMNWKFVNDDFVMVDVLDEEIIRERRQIECFNFVDNRSQLWWSHLTDERRNELNDWYEAWLKAPENKLIPKKLVWLE